jgi:membrane protease YdiL (CAAX protease family)
MLLGLGVLLLAFALAEIALWLQGPAYAGPSALLWSGLALQAMWAALALTGALLAEGRPPAQMLGLGPSRLGVGATLLAVVGLVCVSGAIHNLLAIHALRDVGSLGEIDRSVRAAQGPSRLLALVAVGFAPGVAEELLFRGLIQHTLARVVRPVLAACGAALLFSLAHADLVHSSAALVLGLYLGLVTMFAGSIRPAIAAHVTNNLLSLGFTALPMASIPAHASVAGALLVVGVGALARVAWSARRSGPPG